MESRAVEKQKKNTLLDKAESGDWQAVDHVSKTTGFDVSTEDLKVLEAATLMLKARKVVEKLEAAQNVLNDALKKAVEDLDEEKVKALLIAGADPDLVIMKKYLLNPSFTTVSNPEYRKTSTTVLYHACKERNVSIVADLINAGADVNKDSVVKQGILTPLMTAVTMNDMPMVDALLAAGADCNAHKEKKFVYHYALNQEMLDKLSSAGANIPKEFSLEKSKHSKALLSAVESEDAAAIKALLETATDINYKELNEKDRNGMFRVALVNTIKSAITALSQAEVNDIDNQIKKINTWTEHLSNDIKYASTLVYGVDARKDIRAHLTKMLKESIKATTDMQDQKTLRTERIRWIAIRDKLEIIQKRMPGTAEKTAMQAIMNYIASLEKKLGIKPEPSVFSGWLSSWAKPDESAEEKRMLNQTGPDNNSL